MADDIALIGKTIFRDQETKFGIKTDDRRRHMYLIGRSGVGKTTILDTLTVHDIMTGRGVGVVDPHGEFSERMLKMVPKNRLDDVVYFNPADTEFPIAFNPMEAVGNETRHSIASSLLAVFKKIWPDVWSPRMEYILNNTILALLEYPDATFLGLSNMLANKTFRKQVVDNLTDPVVKAFWTDEFARYQDKFQTEAIAPIQNKVGQFIANPLIRNIIGQPKSKMNLRDIMDNQKILIVRLPTGLVGESNAALLGALVITKLQQAAMARIDTPEAERKDFFLLIDEFQNFATESFISILAEARKYRLCMTLAHQYIEQVPETIQAAILGNVGTMGVFRIGARDAQILEKEFEPTITAQDLVNLPNFNFYIKLMVDGITSQPFLAQTLPPAPAPLQTFEKEIIERSRQKYGTPQPEVEKEIIEQFALRSQDANGTPVDPNAPPVVMHEATCSRCGKNILVPFEPDATRPVYCKNCLKIVQQERAAQGPVQKPRRFVSAAPVVQPMQSSQPQASIDTTQEQVVPAQQPQPQAPRPVQQKKQVSMRDALTQAMQENTQAAPQQQPRIKQQKPIREKKKAGPDLGVLLRDVVAHVKEQEARSPSADGSGQAAAPSAAQPQAAAVPQPDQPAQADQTQANAQQPVEQATQPQQEEKQS